MRVSGVTPQTRTKDGKNALWNYAVRKLDQSTDFLNPDKQLFSQRTSQLRSETSSQSSVSELPVHKACSLQFYKIDDYEY